MLEQPYVEEEEEGHHSASRRTKRMPRRCLNWVEKYDLGPDAKVVEGELAR